MKAPKYSLIRWPALTVRLAELGFIVDHGACDGPEGADACQIDARQTSVIVRGYRAGDEEAIRDLFHRSFHQELSPEMWRWRYADHPLGARRISVALADDGQLLGHYGGYPVEFVHSDSTGASHMLLAHQNGDVMTDRRARRLGHGGATLVRRLAQHFWAAYGEGRVDFHYGFNTDTARTLQRRVVPGVRALEDVSVWTADDARWQLGAAPGATPALTDSLRAERVSRFDAEWDAFAQEVRGAYGLLARRDASSLNWRYATRPGSQDLLIIVRSRERIVGGAVFQLRDGETRWGDALFDPRHPAAVAVALDHLRALGAPSRIRAWFPARPAWWTRILQDLGFHQEREPHGLTLMYAPFTPSAERLLADLYYTWGDSDLF
jgi:hypothetical protein